MAFEYDISIDLFPEDPVALSPRAGREFASAVKEGRADARAEAEMAVKRLVSFVINGRRREDAVSDNLLLLDYLREVAGLTGTKRGCDGGECGACTVLVGDEPRLACLTLAASCEGRKIETIEALATHGRMSLLQRAFHEKLGAQCGYCTPGMIMAAEALLRRQGSPTEADIREALSGNICRCTGYVKIIESVQAAARGG